MNIFIVKVAIIDTKVVILQKNIKASMLDLFQKSGKAEKLPMFDLPVDYLVYDNINIDILNNYTQFPCRIQCGVLAYLNQGSVKSTINLWDYEVKQSDFVVVLPGTFIQIRYISPDTRISFIGFSSKFMQSNNFMKSMSKITMQLFRNPVLTLEPQMSELYSDAMSLLARAGRLDNFPINPSVIKSIMEIFVESLSDIIAKQKTENKRESQSREHAVLSEFLQLAFENYREEHKISFYAHEVNLTLSHFCNVISKTTGMTPQEIIMNMIIMDAKTQLKGTQAPVSKIALSLGFPTPTTFTRYFRTYTGMTPQEYRNS